jgi:hypothetical protein
MIKMMRSGVVVEVVVVLAVVIVAVVVVVVVLLVVIVLVAVVEVILVSTSVISPSSWLQTRSAIFTGPCCSSGRQTRLSTAEVRVQSLVTSCEICGE